MNERILKSISIIVRNYFGKEADEIIPLPESGSYRKYFRVVNGNQTAIAVYNEDLKENIAFLSFTEHFLKFNLPVPKILAKDLENNGYLLEDLGDDTLFSLLIEKRKEGKFPEEVIPLYKKTLDYLPLIQVKASVGFDYSVCYPRPAFDKQSMFWDLNYFKYYFLKLAKIPFDEQKLENDFHAFADYLLTADANYFLYRDFQSRNVMIKNGEPYFIDYQGGRKGALQYDLASLLFDAKADLPHSLRAELLDYYIANLKKIIPVDEIKFKQYFFGYTLIRILQAMGAFGFRGFYEKKEHFLQSIPFALDNLDWLLKNVEFPVQIDHLSGVLKKMIDSPELQKFKLNKKRSELKITIKSFSYARGIPEDSTGTGGGFVFDCRLLHNPGRYEDYKSLTGKDDAVKEFMKTRSDAEKFLTDVFSVVDRAIDAYLERRFWNLSVYFGCTGGQHRSVYCAERLKEHLQEKYNIQIELNHTELEKE
ncbi:MAG: phosphotransferase [Chlorobi bacterium]|nr:phosphotransferase [Chlorobiota bacterium]